MYKMPPKTSTAKTASKGKNAKNAKTTLAVEPVVVVENIVIEKVEETAPDYDTEEEPEIIETTNEAVDEVVDEESDDEDLKALQALQKKIKQKELKKNIIVIRKAHTDAFKNDLTRKEQQLKNLLEEIETIKQSIKNVENGDDDELLINAELHKATKTQTIKAVKPEGGSKRISTDKKRPTNLTECFKRKTLLHHNKSGINEYAFIYEVNGLVYACDENGIKKEGGEGFKTLNAFTNKNYADKNERLGETRTTRNNAYIELKYKNDAGIWCSCEEVISGNILTQ